eukprot:TRINITY_DN14_c0_g1_i7.p1 TRINITY_DN14_c0_g1~~TRINITY_DN14_c0_g1_i7.p1  ORF type:complete len:459 (-),score=49.64 TRINITY_DN14_c0_g1_i7:160-1458(-)
MLLYMLLITVLFSAQVQGSQSKFRNLLQASTTIPRETCDLSNYDGEPSPECYSNYEMSTPGSNLLDVARFPYLISIQEDRLGQPDCYYHRCGGALISTNLVLTAAHCLFPSVSPGSQNSTGASLIQNLYASFTPFCRHQNGFVTDRTSIDRVWIHPGYDHEDLDDEDDIAIARLSQPAVGAQTIKYQSPGTKLQEQTRVVAGWGYYDRECWIIQLGFVTFFYSSLVLSAQSYNMRRAATLFSRLPCLGAFEVSALRVSQNAVQQLCCSQSSSFFSTFKMAKQYDDMDDFDERGSRMGGGSGGMGGGGGRRPQRQITMDFGDVQEGSVYPGKVVGITGFGAFVDIGCGIDGLVHVSQISNEYVREVRDYVDIGHDVQVKVLGKDLDRNKLSFTMKMDQQGGGMNRADGRNDSFGGDDMGGPDTRRRRDDDDDF